ncbi:MAG: zinc ABC transporter substrate-binding protein, partial [Thermomicrobiales bacterium]|nr:zinc ABC transporter substrate-binding protein [Thermomicrobiales bacterium]
MSTSRRTLIAAGGVTLAGIVLGSPLARVAPARAQDQAPIAVATTIGMIADLVRNTGGDRVDVTALMGPGVDPHLYKPSSGELRKLTDADVILYNGLHLEGRMADVLVKMASRTNTVQVTDTIP